MLKPNLIFRFKCVPSSLSLFLLLGTLSAFQETQAQVHLKTQKQAIRNGSLKPKNILLSYEQEKAIGWLKTGSGRFCSATVISDFAVLTAKHCFYGELAPPRSSNFSFAIMSDQALQNQREDPITNPFIPEAEFNFRFEDVFAMSNLDLAVIRFQGRPFNRAGLKAIPINVYPLEGKFRQNLTGAMVDVAGFGDTKHNNEYGRYFASVKLELITATYVVTNGQNEQGICNGDSGGPLLAAGVDGQVSIIAIVTNGDECCVGFDQLTRVDIEAQKIIEYTQAYTSSPNPGSGYTENCWGIPQRFQCRGQKLHFCSNGDVAAVDCQESGKFCDFDQVDQRFDCISPAESSCPNVPASGLCLNPNTLIRCEYGEERRISCVASSCQKLVGGERFACISGESAHIECDPNNESRLEWASEAVFSSSSSCATRAQEQKSTWPDVFFLMMIILGKIFNRKTKEI